MKKWMLILLALTLMFCMIACQKPSSTDEGKNNDDQQTPGGSTNEGEKNEVDLSGTITEEMVRSYKVAPATDFEYENVAGGVKITKYIGSDLIVVIPETIDGKSVVEVKTYLFANDSMVKGVWFPNAVKTLKYTFGNNENIQVVICEGVERLLDYTFGGCTAIHTIKLGNNLIELGRNCICMCPALSSVYIPPSMVTINAENVYSIIGDCPNLTIQGEAGSFIESYCTQYNIPFEAK